MAGVASVGDRSSGRGEESQGGVFPSICMILKCGELLVWIGWLELEGGAGMISSLKDIFAELWESWLVQVFGVIKLEEEDWISLMKGWL